MFCLVKNCVLLRVSIFFQLCNSCIQHYVLIGNNNINTIFYVLVQSNNNIVNIAIITHIIRFSEKFLNSNPVSSIVSTVNNKSLSRSKTLTSTVFTTRSKFRQRYLPKYVDILSYIVSFFVENQTSLLH